MITPYNFLQKHKSFSIFGKIGLAFIFALLLFDLVMAGTTPVQGIRDKTPDLKAFTNARIYVSPEKVLDKATLVIKDGLVQAVGSEVKIPDGAFIIDLTGKTIYPGFIDSYTDYGIKIDNADSHRPRGRFQLMYNDRIGGNAWNGAIHSEQDWVTHFCPDDNAAEDFMKQGFTTVQSCNPDGIFRGRSFIASLGDGLPNDMVIKPYAWQFASFDKGSSPQAYPGSLMGSIALIRQMLYDVDWYTKAQAAYKLNPDQKMPEFNAAIEALENIGQEKIFFNTDDDYSLLRADKVSREFNIPFIHVGSGSEYVLADEIKKAGVSLIIPVNYPDKPEVGSMEDALDLSLTTLRHWEMAPSNAAILSHNDIPFAFTTAGLKKKSMFLPNLREAIKRGLASKTALAALTTIPAELCGISDVAGTLDKGKRADFFICSGDIFDDDVNIYSVWTGGTEKELEPLPVCDHRGEYELPFNGATFKLSFEGTPEKPKGTFSLDSLSGDIDVISVELDQIDFNLNLDTLEISGIVRFGGRLKDDILSGQYLLPDGTRGNFQAQRVSPYKPKDEPEEEKEEAAKPELVSKLTRPDLPYGMAELPQQQDVLIRNATVWTSEDAGILKNTDVLIKDGKFAEIGTVMEAPKGVKIIDGTGKHVTAGIIDKHSHLAIDGDVNECTEAITCEVRIGDVVRSNDIGIYRQLAGGVTTSILLHGSCNPIGGQAQVIKLRYGQDADGLKFDTGPTFVKFALGENVKQSGWEDVDHNRYPQTRMGVEAIIKDVFQAGKEYKADWDAYNFLSKKVQKMTVPPRRNLRLDEIVNLLEDRDQVVCHAYVQSEMLMMMDLADEYGVTVATFDHGLEGYKIAPELAAHNVGVTTFSDWWAYKFEVYDAIPQNAGLLHQNGVVVSINSDSRELARHLNQEAGKSVMYTGMSQEDALKMVTIYPAQQLRAADRIGSIKAGKDADFVIWNGNPLSVYSKPEQTWIDGCCYFDLKRDKELREEIKTEKNALIQEAFNSEGGKGNKSPGKGGHHRPSESLTFQQAGE